MNCPDCGKFLGAWGHPTAEAIALGRHHDLYCPARNDICVCGRALIRTTSNQAGWTHRFDVENPDPLRNGRRCVHPAPVG